MAEVADQAEQAGRASGGPVAPSRPGDTLAGRYRLDDLLSESGSGRFWLARDRVLQRHVALHVIGCDDARAPGLLDAARRSATVVDPRILRVLDAQMRSDACLVVNEWGWGTSLDIALANNGPLDPRPAAWLVAQVAEAVAVAHHLGVHHGRLVPENVLIDTAGVVRIIGFAVDAALHGLPPGDTESDLRDLGGLVHACLTGRWAGESASAVTPAPRSGRRVLRPRQVRAGVPRPLDDLADVLVNHTDERERHDLGTATDVAAHLADYVGDPAGIPEHLAAANPLRGPRLVVLDPVPDIALRPGLTDDREPAPEPSPGSADHDPPSDQDPPAGPADPGPDATEVAAQPVDDAGQEHTARPLFAPEPDADAEARTRARAERAARAGEPRRTSASSTSATSLTRPVGPTTPTATPDDAPTAPRRPGQQALRAAAVLALALVLLVAAAVVWSAAFRGDAT